MGHCLIISVLKKSYRLKIKCVYCNKYFDGDAKFCSQNCRDSYILEISKRAKEATEKDTSHTKKFSDDK